MLVQIKRKSKSHFSIFTFNQKTLSFETGNLHLTLFKPHSYNLMIIQQLPSQDNRLFRIIPYSLPSTYYDVTLTLIYSRQWMRKFWRYKSRNRLKGKVRVQRESTVIPFVFIHKSSATRDETCLNWQPTFRSDFTL